MVRQSQKLTPLAVSRKTAPGMYGDGLGLWLRISAVGAKSWIFRFMLNGKAREMGLGATHTINLTEAREKARECRKLLDAGIDPIDAREAQNVAARIEAAKAVTFDWCAEKYIAANRAGWKNAKHAAQWASTLKTYASPIIGTLPVAKIDMAMVLKVLTQKSDGDLPLWEAKNETATRLRSRIESVLSWATPEYRTGDNPARWQGNLKGKLANISKASRVKHHPALPYAQMGSFMKALRAQEGVGARALELAILTAARSGEVRGATWDEFDLKGGIWIIPKDRMKAGKQHHVPLSAPAVALLKKAKQDATGPLVFPGLKAGKPLSDMSLSAVVRRMNEGDKPKWIEAPSGAPVVPHGFRSTFRDWAGETTNHPREVIEHALAHLLKDAAEAAYQRGDLLAKRRLLMEDWAAFCAREFKTGGKVLPMQRKERKTTA